MSLTLYIWIFVLSVVFLLLGYYFYQRKENLNESHFEGDAKQEAPSVNSSRRAGTSRMRQRRGNKEPEPNLDREDVDVVHEEENPDENSEFSAVENRKKDAKKKEKQQRREAERATRDIKEERSNRYSEKQRQKEEERQEEEDRLALELAEFEARRTAEAAAELAQWKGSFQVETEGFLETEMREKNERLLEDFVQYIQEHKCVALEELAAEFGIRTQEVVEKVMSLEKEGRISGVMDDRGKFIFVSLEEMRAVASYIEQRGRISISQLAEKTLDLIDLEPKSAVAGTDLLEPWLEEGNRNGGAENAVLC